jgi:hypothetical protein
MDRVPPLRELILRNSRMLRRRLSVQDDDRRLQFSSEDANFVARRLFPVMVNPNTWIRTQYMRINPMSAPGGAFDVLGRPNPVFELQFTLRTIVQRIRNNLEFVWKQQKAVVLIAVRFVSKLLMRVKRRRAVAMVSRKRTLMSLR